LLSSVFFQQLPEKNGLLTLLCGVARVMVVACSIYWRNLTHVFATQWLRVLRKTSPLIMALPRQLVMVARILPREKKESAILQGLLERRRRKARKGKNIYIVGTRSRTYMLQI
jgi:hypothetical protein